MFAIPSSITQLPAYASNPVLALHANNAPNPISEAFVASFENFCTRSLLDFQLSDQVRTDIVKARASLYNSLNPQPSNEVVLAELAKLATSVNQLNANVTVLTENVTMVSSDVKRLEQRFDIEAALAINRARAYTDLALVPVPARGTGLLRPVGIRAGENLTTMSHFSSLARVKLDKWLDLYGLPITTDLKTDQLTLAGYITGGMCRGWN